MVPKPVVDEMAVKFQDSLAKLQAQVDESKRTIASLLRQIHGPRAETSQVVLDAEGQQFIDGVVGGLQKAAPTVAPETAESASAKPPRTKPLGLAARNPSVPIVEREAPIPPELQEQVDQGVLAVRRTRRYEDRLNTTPRKSVIERVWEVELVKRSTAQAVMVVPMPACITPQGVLANDLIHQFIIAKFLDAIPFHRFLAGLAREGVDIPRQTVNDAFRAWANLFAPLAATIIDDVLASDVVHADDSWGRVHAPKSCTPGHVWTLVGTHQVGYCFTEGRTHRALADVLPLDFAGYLVTDAWSGWKQMQDAELAGCNAHARRPYAKLADDNPDAAAMVRLYAELYAVEAEARTGPPEHLQERRRALRQTRSRAIMDRIEAEAARIAVAYPSRHPLAIAGRYIDNHRDALRRFLDEPRLPPDNNAAENALRINALIRKNSLFFGSEDGGHRAAIALTILHSCRMAKVEPLAYLKAVTPELLRARDGRQVDLAALMPVRYATRSN